MTDHSALPPMPPAPDSGPVTRGPAPSTVVNTVRLMYLSAVLALIGAAAAFLTKDEFKTIIAKDTGLTGNELDTALTLALGTALVFGLVFVALWLVLARFVGQGKNWARIVTWVVAAFGVLGLVGIVGLPPLTVVLSVAGGIIDLVIIVLLAMKPSADYFANRPAA